MKPTKSFCSCLAAALLIVLASATIVGAQAGSDTCVGEGATLGGTCAPLTNTASGNFDNTALGAGALESNTGGAENTAAGWNALHNNTNGNSNAAIGMRALADNTTGGANAAVGSDALGNNTTGDDNTAIGVQALQSNSTGRLNTAIGAVALGTNFTGSNNTAIGVDALENSTTASSNIAIGFQAGQLLTTGDDNIDIFDGGVAGESNTIRIGTQGTQTATFVAGIYEEKVGKKHCSVLVDSDGRLGCGSSKVVDTSMLLNELQKQTAQMAAMKASMRRQAAELKASHERELTMRTTFEERLSRLEQMMASKNGSHNLAAAFNR